MGARGDRLCHWISAVGARHGTGFLMLAMACLSGCCGGDGAVPAPQPITTPSTDVEALLSGFVAPRTVHISVDGRLIITDLGNGRNNGSVAVIDLTLGTRDIALSRLPSTRNSGQRFADLAGPSGAGVAPDGIACAATGDATTDRRGFNALICSDGRSFDLEALEERLNPGGGETESNPFDTVWVEGFGWLVSDAAANTLLTVAPSGQVRVAAIFPQLPGSADEREGVPTGLFAGDGRLFLALFNGAVVELSISNNALLVERVELFTRPIAVHLDESGLYVLEYANEAGEPRTGLIVHLLDDGNRRTVLDGLEFPTGMARLPAGEFIVAEEAAGRVRLLRGSP